MPFIIAGLVYGGLALPVLAVIAGVCLARRRAPGWATVGGVAGSLAGFLAGCVAAALLCIAVPTVGRFTGATAVVVVVGLGTALLGTMAGVLAVGRAHRSGA